MKRNIIRLVLASVLVIGMLVGMAVVSNAESGANFNAAIEALTVENEALRDDIDALVARTTALESVVENITGTAIKNLVTADDLATAIAAENARIDTIEAAVEEIKGKVANLESVDAPALIAAAVAPLAKAENVDAAVAAANAKIDAVAAALEELKGNVSALEASVDSCASAADVEKAVADIAALTAKVNALEGIDHDTLLKSLADIEKRLNGGTDGEINVYTLNEALNKQAATIDELDSRLVGTTVVAIIALVVAVVACAGAAYIFFVAMKKKA